MLILSADLGVVNLAFCLIHVEEKLLGDPNQKPVISVLGLWHIDMTIYTHKVVSRDQCRLYHTKETSDRLMHVIQEHESLWESHGPIDLYLIERQPLLGGMVHIEELLFQRYRHKIRKVSPNGMHRWLNLSDSYETRKEQVVELARPWLEAFPVFANATRKHDQSDAFVLACYEIHKMHEKAKVIREAAKRKRQIDEECQKQHGKSLNVMFEEYRYTESQPPKRSKTSDS